jgi:hypothetical protein
MHPSLGAVPRGPHAPHKARALIGPDLDWRFNVADHQRLNQKLMHVIEVERQRDPAGMGGRSTRSGWHSSDQLHQHPGMQELVAILHENVSVKTFGPTGSIPRRSPWNSPPCWAIMNGKLVSGVIHCHPKSFRSSVYNVNTNDESGDILFQDPRHVASMWSWPVTEHTPVDHSAGHVSSGLGRNA